jgi:hypothetical protein
MDRKFVFLYSVLACAIGVALFELWPTTPEAPVVGEKIPARLSAIVENQEARLRPGDVLATSEIEALQARIQLLEAQLESLQVESSDGKERTPMDIETFCTHYAYSMRMTMGIVATDALAAALELTEAERAAFDATAKIFYQRLQVLDRASVELVYSDDEVIRLKIPYHVEGRDKLFDSLKDELHQLLGSERGRIAEEVFYRNELIGSASSERNLWVKKNVDGDLRLEAQIVPMTAYFPGTEIPYDGTPGVEPELVTSRNLKTSTGVSGDQVEELLGALVDLENWQLRSPK